jgi:asparaginyl-tRNA synthetase
MNSSANIGADIPVTTIREVGQHEGQTVIIRGWLYNLRASGKLLFPIFRDGSGIIQGVVAKNAVSPELFEAIKGLTQESSVIVTGNVRADKRAPGGFELDVSDAQVLQRVNPDDPYPISPKEHGVDFLMEHRHLWLRSPRQASILRVRAEIIKAARDFFDDRGFTLTDPPILTPAACEGTSSTLKRRRWRWARCTASGRPSARKNRRRAATSPSSGWSSRKWLTQRSTT